MTIKVTTKMKSIFSVSITFYLVSAISSFADTVNIYSYRQPDLIAPLLEKFTRKTGVETEIQFLKKGMVETES